MKAPDCWTVPLCVECHREFDQGSKWTKLAKRELMDEWILLTVLGLASSGQLKVKA